ncbi:hypothetical protein Aglo01_43510 [Actinokineospora globicatena]|uniref:Uncharacterized protein n=2 Tax=Actinokineospora TaxID=39845 RepID=A0A9W6V917_9PSEU|nr:hypothetical protein Aglo01_43510 [Actinokineospora globicatena]GLW90513.1 hypothetical protein Aglo03_13290 [Actinokineospora globicatena]
MRACCGRVNHPLVRPGNPLLCSDSLVPRTKECEMAYETWESLADEVEISTGAADCWVCLVDA